MLTGDLAISFWRGGRVYPKILRVTDEVYLRDAENLIDIFESAIGKTREDLKSEFEEYVGTGTDYKVLRGFEKLLLDRCEFAVESIAEPAEIRRKLFFAAKNFHTVLQNNREEVLRQVANEFNAAPEQIVAALYADLPAQQKLLKFQTTTPRELIERYNLAQTQALFYRCGEMKIWADPQPAAGYRRIFTAIKYFKLIHSISGEASRGYEITLGGAASVFHRSQKYGIQMAVFLPALLVCENWRLRAEIDGKTVSAIYELDSKQTDLRSCYEDEPEYENPIHERLISDWTKTDNNWFLKENREIVNLGRTAFIPDFVLQNIDGNKIFLEILGFWTPESLRNRLAQFAAAKFENFIIAAWEELRGSRSIPPRVPDNVILFKSKLDPRVLAQTAEKLTVLAKQNFE
jgi:predicted nuclease of restriction endonuclease-like RecB superfamily